LACQQFDKTWRMEVFPRRLAASGCWRGGRVGIFPGPAGLLDGPAQDELDLPVEATQIVVSPALEDLQQRGIDTKKKRLSFSHATS